MTLVVPLNLVSYWVLTKVLFDVFTGLEFDVVHMLYLEQIIIWVTVSEVIRKLKI